MRIRTQRSARAPQRFALLAAVITLAVGGAAFALWSVYGSGDGAGATAETTALTLSSGTPMAGLYPGGQGGVAVRITNPNVSPIVVLSLELNPNNGMSGFTIDAPEAGCTVDSFEFAPQSNGGAGWTVPGRSGSIDGALDLSLPDSLVMSRDAPNACQGAVVTVHLMTGS